MIPPLVQLIILFFVIFDPLASFAVFLAASSSMKKEERIKTGIYAVLIAALLSLAVILLGETLLELFNTNINEFKVAGGIILGILGVKMALGHSLVANDTLHERGRAISAIIATPLLTGPAAITAMLISVHDYGMALTGLSVEIVLIFTAWLFFSVNRVGKFFGRTAIQIIYTILGIITLAWGVKFVVSGLQVIMASVG